MQRAILISLVLATAFGGAGAQDIEIGYDEGPAAGIVFHPVGSASAVQFTPPTYPVKIVKTKMYLDIHEPSCDLQSVWLLDDDGQDGQPGSVLFGPMRFVTPQEIGGEWVEFSLPDTSDVVVH
ncbi:MAG: hypothetical protein KJ927_14290, partial [Candidatus Eisenbacteria bacterium]|nr:hypothetical protein [Candidatus Eisenbacteria bacterium]